MSDKKQESLADSVFGPLEPLPKEMAAIPFPVQQEAPAEEPPMEINKAEAALGGAGIGLASGLASKLAPAPEIPKGPNIGRLEESLRKARNLVRVLEEEGIPPQSQAPRAPSAPIPGRVEPSIVPSAQQAARIQSGGTGDVLGTTGRARQTGYTERTAQEAARREMASKTQQELAKRGIVSGESVLAKAPGLTSTPGGLLIPSELSLEQELQQRMQPKPPAGPTPKMAAEMTRAQRAAKLAEMNLEEAKKLQPSAAKKIGAMAGRAPVVTGVLGGAGAGLSVAEALERWKAGDRSGAVLAALAGILGTMSMVPPVGPGAVVRGVGTVGGLGMIPLMMGHDYLKGKE